MPQLLIATTNPAKLTEYSLLMREFNLRLVSLRDVGIDREAPGKNRGEPGRAGKSREEPGRAGKSREEEAAKRREAGAIPCVR